MQPSVIDRMDELAVHAALLIVEDHSLTAQGLAFALTQERYPVSIVTGAALRTQLARGWRADSPTIALLDLQLDVGLSGIDFIGPLTDAGAVVIMLTGITDPIRLAECLEAGAVALASKTGSLDGLLRTISDVERGFPAIESDERARLIDDLHAHRAEEAERLGPFARLTPRERDVLAAIVDGRKAEDIAAASYVSITTVRSQIYSVKQKLGATSQVAAIAMARRAGWTHD